jgi:hypothetical protein
MQLKISTNHQRDAGPHHGRDDFFNYLKWLKSV